MIEISLVTLFIVFLGLFFILMSLFLYMVVRKYSNNMTRQKIDGLKEQARLDMFHFLQTGEGEVLGTDSPERLQALLELLAEYSNVLEGAEVQERIHSFANRHLTMFIRKELKKRRWSLRMNALYSIEDFYMADLEPELVEMYKKKRITAAEKAQILLLLAKFNHPDVISYIERDGQELSNFSVLTIVSHLHEERFGSLADDFSNLSPKLQYAIVDTIGDKQLTRYEPLLRKLLELSDDELKIRSLKAYANSGMPVDERMIGKFLDSEDWRIRMMAIKVVGTQRLELYKETLVRQLSDREYSVRSEAAKAIVRFRDGQALLKKVMGQTQDLFAKDMAREWLEKEGGQHSY